MTLDDLARLHDEAAEALGAADDAEDSEAYDRLYERLAMLEAAYLNHPERAAQLAAIHRRGALPMNRKHPEAFDQFAILEIIGHRCLGGRVRETTIGGIPLIRIDVFRDGAEPVTGYYGPSSIFCLTPATEEAARAASTFVPPLEEFKIEAKANAKIVEALEEALAALQDAEWKGFRSFLDTLKPCCPVCKALEETGQHAEGCALSAALGGNDIPF